MKVVNYAERALGMVREALVNSPLNHARFLHGSGQGCITVGCIVDGEWQEVAAPLEKLEGDIEAHGGLDNVYITQNRFYGPKKGTRLAELSAMFSDIDYYKVPGLNEARPEHILHLALEELERAKIPRPALAVATGRGLALVWRHTPVPPQAKSRWKLCQDRIFKTLKGLGADSSARDTTRMLRLVGTVNPKSGEEVRAIWQEAGDATWNFDDLANEILPYTREQIAERRARRREKGVTRAARKPRKGRGNILKRFTPSTLALTRLGDLQHLLEIRGQEQVPHGQRDAWMFAAGASLACLVEAGSLEERLIRLGRDYAGWSASETRSRMNSVISLAREAAADKKVEWNGRQRDPRYWLTNEKIIEDLGITPGEEREMKTIISADTKRRRDTLRKRKKRRAEGAVPRYEIAAKSSEKKRTAKALRSEGMSLRKIAEKIGVSHAQVWRWTTEDAAEQYNQ